MLKLKCDCNIIVDEDKCSDELLENLKDKCFEFVYISFDSDNEFDGKLISVEIDWDTLKEVK